MTTEHPWRTYRRERMELLEVVIRSEAKDLALTGDSIILRQLFSRRASLQKQIDEIDSQIRKANETALVNYKNKRIAEIEYALLRHAKTEKDVRSASVKATNKVESDWRIVEKQLGKQT